MSEQQYSREPIINADSYNCEVFYNPVTHHWYEWWYSTPVDSLPTRQGLVKVNTLTEKKNVICFAAFNIDHFSAFDIHFMKDKNGLIGIFVMVDTVDDAQGFYRTDRGGFGYESVKLYFDSYSYPNTGATHFIITKYKTGEWGAFAVCHHKELFYYLSDYCEFIDRKGLVKGGQSEQEVLELLKNKYKVDLKSNCFKRYDIDTFLRQ